MIHFLRAWLRKCDFKDENHLSICVVILDKRSLDHNMTQFITKEQAKLQLALWIAWYYGNCIKHKGSQSVPISWYFLAGSAQFLKWKCYFNSFSFPIAWIMILNVRMRWKVHRVKFEMMKRKCDKMDLWSWRYLERVLFQYPNQNKIHAYYPNVSF